LISVTQAMSDNNTHPDFRYPNNNRDLPPGTLSYPSQQKVGENSQKGDRDYYANDNGGHYASSNRQSLTSVDPLNKKQAPNSNYKTP
tara:strand:- start:3975 stop:4235 length:261 start_codon:yes stop_codon:yes gene_type:complete